MLPDPRIHVVFEPSDRAESEQLLRSLGDLRAGRLLVQVSADGRNLEWLAKDVAIGLGKDVDLSGSGRNAQESWERVMAWVAGERVEHILVSRAHHLDRHRWELLIELASLSGSSLWLVVQVGVLNRNLRETVRDWPCRSLGFDEFVALQRAAYLPSQAPPGTGGAAFPTVPDDDFTSFRSSCRGLLAPAAFAVVDGVFLQVRSQTGDWLRAQPSRDEEGIAGYLGGLLRAGSIHEQVTRLRGAQTAFFWAGFKVRVDIERLTAVSGMDTQREIDESAARKLRLYLHPTYAAVGLIAAMGVGPHQLVAATMADVDEDGSTVRMGGHFHSIPVFARDILRAHLAQRWLQGAGDDNILFVAPGRTEFARQGPYSTAPLGWRGAKHRLRMITQETGLALTSYW